MKKQILMGTLIVSSLATSPVAINAQSADNCTELGHVTAIGDADYETKFDRDGDGIGCESQSNLADVQAAEERAKEYYANQNKPAEDTTADTPTEDTTVDTPTEDSTVDTPTEDSTVDTPNNETKENTNQTTTTDKNYKMADTASSVTLFGKIKMFFTNLF